jgi:hypothetical protein
MPVKAAGWRAASLAGRRALGGGGGTVWNPVVDLAQAVRDGTGWNIVSALSRDALAKLPAAGS